MNTQPSAIVPAPQRLLIDSNSDILRPIGSHVDQFPPHERNQTLRSVKSTCRDGKRAALCMIGGMGPRAHAVLAAPRLSALFREAEALPNLRKLLHIGAGLRNLTAWTGPLGINVPLHLIDPSIGRFLLLPPGGGTAPKCELVIDTLTGEQFASREDKSAALQQAIDFLHDRCADTAEPDRVQVSLKLALPPEPDTSHAEFARQLFSGLRSYGRVRALHLVGVCQSHIKPLIEALENNALASLHLYLAQPEKVLACARLLASGMWKLSHLREFDLGYGEAGPNHDEVSAILQPVENQVYRLRRSQPRDDDNYLSYLTVYRSSDT
ncbi:MAG: hypothetical protein JWP36_2488 [Paucimonas sp.]|nr:hypothetical protein [Paucimonas sp.]